MKVSKQARRSAKELFRSCLKEGVLDDVAVKQGVEKILQTRPRGWLSILSHFKRLVQLDLDRRTACVESAVPVTGPLQNEVRANLSKLYGPGLNFTFSHNPGLIGGMRIKVGSDVYDGSVQGRLAVLQESF